MTDDDLRTQHAKHARFNLGATNRVYYTLRELDYPPTIAHRIAAGCDMTFEEWLKHRQQGDSHDD